MRRGFQKFHDNPATGGVAADLPCAGTRKHTQFHSPNAGQACGYTSGGRKSYRLCNSIKTRNTYQNRSATAAKRSRAAATYWSVGYTRMMLDVL